eukprot:Polyplicarium_translucidae@DN1740_c0_g1_i3.p1
MNINLTQSIDALREKLAAQQRARDYCSQTRTSSHISDELRAYIGRNKVFQPENRGAAWKVLLDIPTFDVPFAQSDVSAGVHMATRAVCQHVALRPRTKLDNRLRRQVSLLLGAEISLLKRALRIDFAPRKVLAEEEEPCTGFAPCCWVPQLIYPFVKVFGADEAFCHQVIRRVFAHGSGTSRRFVVPHSSITLAVSDRN